MKKVLPFVFALSIASGPVFAWGDSNCSFKNKEANQQDSTQEMEKAKPSKNN